jgi:hypothetical protein
MAEGYIGQGVEYVFRNLKISLDNVPDLRLYFYQFIDKLNYLSHSQPCRAGFVLRAGGTTKPRANARSRQNVGPFLVSKIEFQRFCLK